jgi:1,4-alpha-glucan branching enzyme
MKWDMGWMHDTLDYLSQDPIDRKFHHHNLTFRLHYAFNENFMLALSHDEVVYGKGSLIAKMPGDIWQMFASVRLLFGWMYAQPGKKLMFMGDEFGQWREWDHDRCLDWDLLEQPDHAGLSRWVEDLNHILCSEKALHELDFEPSGFSWIDANDAEQSVVSVLRRGAATADVVIAALNFTPVPRYNYQIGVPRKGRWRELLNSDAARYGGTRLGNGDDVYAVPDACHGYRQSIRLTLPPLAAVFLRPEPQEADHAGSAS